MTSNSQTSNKSNIDEEDNYLTNFNFLQNEGSIVNKSAQSEGARKPQTSINTKNTMTIDKLSKNQVDLNKAAHAVLTEVPMQCDNMMLSKTVIQQALESPELNKKLRTQNEYNQSLTNNKESSADKKISKHKDMTDIIYNNDFDIEKFKDDKDNNKVIKNEIKKFEGQLDIVGNVIQDEDKRQKVFRIKKKKENFKEEVVYTNNTNHTNENIYENSNTNNIIKNDITNKDPLVNKNQNDINKFIYIPIFFTSVMLSVYLRKKLFKFRINLFNFKKK